MQTPDSGLDENEREWVAHEIVSGFLETYWEHQSPNQSIQRMKNLWTQKIQDNVRQKVIHHTIIHQNSEDTSWESRIFLNMFWAKIITSKLLPYIPKLLENAHGDQDFAELIIRILGESLFEMGDLEDDDISYGLQSLKIAEKIRETDYSQAEKFAFNTGMQTFDISTYNEWWIDPSLSEQENSKIKERYLESIEEHFEYLAKQKQLHKAYHQNIIK